MTFVISDRPTKSTIILLRLNDYEEAALRIAAAEEDVTRSDWVISQIALFESESAAIIASRGRSVGRSYDDFGL